MQSRLPLIKGATLRRGGGFNIDMWQASVYYSAVAPAFSTSVAFLACVLRHSHATLTPVSHQCLCTPYAGDFGFKTSSPSLPAFPISMVVMGDFGAAICSCGLQWRGATIHPYVIMPVAGHSSSSSFWIVLISTGVSSGSTTVRAREEL